MDFFNPTFTEQMKKYDVRMPTNMFMSNYFMFQAPCSILSSSAIKNSAMGSFSYVGYSVLAINTFIGRYCSIANNTQFGLKRKDYSLAVMAPFLDEDNCFDFAGLSLHDMHVSGGRSKEHHEVITLGHDVWVGFNALIQEGVHIGTGAIIGADTVVTKDVPPYAVVVGTDHIVRQRFSDEIIADLLASKWWEYNLPLMAKRGIELPYEQPEKLSSLLASLSDEQKIKLDDHWIGIKIPKNKMDIKGVSAVQCPDKTVKEFFERLNVDPEIKLF